MDIRRKLGFTRQWSALGIVDSAKLETYASWFATGDDPNPEHYRWHAFTGFVNERRPLPSELCEALYELGGRDPDRAMGLSMQFTIVSLPECPESVDAKALLSGDKALIREVERKHQGAADLSART